MNTEIEDALKNNASAMADLHHIIFNTVHEAVSDSMYSAVWNGVLEPTTTRVQRITCDKLYELLWN
jgi:hypothetical protein